MHALFRAQGRMAKCLGGSAFGVLLCLPCIAGQGSHPVLACPERTRAGIPSPTRNRHDVGASRLWTSCGRRKASRNRGPGTAGKAKPTTHSARYGDKNDDRYTMTVVGNLTTDPEVRFTASGTAVANSPSHPAPGYSTRIQVSGVTATPCSCAAPCGSGARSTSPTASSRVPGDCVWSAPAAVI